MPESTSAAQPIRIDWSRIDTVLLDMDGTLLDLKFDNYFWLELVPAKFAERRSIGVDVARAQLDPLFEAHRGQLNWYCTDFWSRELGLSIAALKQEAQARIGWLPGAKEFLERLRALNKRTLLVTNAHGDTLRIKEAQTGLAAYFEACISSHAFGHPKEHARFWECLQEAHPFDRSRTLFVDDSLPVLRAARQYGIAHVVAISHPDTSREPKDCDEFFSVSRIELLR